MNFFEKNLNKKRVQELSIPESTRLQKLLSAKALKGAADSKRISSGDIRKMIRTNFSGPVQTTINYDNLLTPFDLI